MLHFIHYQLDLAEGEAVEVYFDSAGTIGGTGVNVQLVDDVNLELYRRGEPFAYTGGNALSAPVTLAPPAPGRWHLVLDLGGGPGRLRATYRVLSAQPS